MKVQKRANLASLQTADAPPIPRKQRITCCVDSNAQLGQGAAPSDGTNERGYEQRAPGALSNDWGDEAGVKKNKGPHDYFFLLFSAELRRGGTTLGPRWTPSVRTCSSC